MFQRVRTPGEPFDISLFAWVGELPDPSEFIDAMLAYYTPTGFLEAHATGTADTRREQARRRRANRGLRRLGPRHRGPGSAIHPRGQR